MDAKRSQSFRKAPTPKASKLKMTKTQSQASVTPSQMSELNRANADKNPLDALSRNTMRQTMPRRSGLQDIDDEYMQMLTNSTQNAPKFEHAAGKRTPNRSQDQTGSTVFPVAQQPNQPMTVAQEQFQSAQTMQQPNVAAADMNAIQQQQQSQQQQQQQQSNFTPAAGEPEMCTTCPHCQTIIYLAAPVAEPQMNQIMHGQPEGAPVGKS